MVTNPTVCRRLHQNAKQSDPGHLNNLFYILCGHFDEKNLWYPLTRGRVSCQSPKVGGWLPPANILSHHYEKYLHDMDLKLTKHVRKTISLLYKQKNKKKKTNKKQTNKNKTKQQTENKTKNSVSIRFLATSVNNYATYYHADLTLK